MAQLTCEPRSRWLSPAGPILWHVRGKSSGKNLIWRTPNNYTKLEQETYLVMTSTESVCLPLFLQAKRIVPPEKCTRYNWIDFADGTSK